MDQLLYPTPGRIGPDRLDIEFNFVCNAGSNPVTINLASNMIATIVYTATGKYLVTFNSGWNAPKIAYATADLEDVASPDGAYASIGNFSNEGTSSALSFQVSTFNAGGSLTQFAASPARRVFVALVIRNSSETSSGYA